MIPFALTVALAAAFPFGDARTGRVSGILEQREGIWAAAAESPYPQPTFAPSILFSPNNDAYIKSTETGLSWGQRQGKEHPLQVLVNPPLMEVLRAHDSRKFLINVSDGGLVGTWDTKIYSIDGDGRPTSLDLRAVVSQTMNKFMRCRPEEDANLGTVAWLNKDTEVLLVAEVPPHSSCENMGKIFGFRISLESKKIIEFVPEQNLRTEWAGALGRRFEKSKP